MDRSVVVSGGIAAVVVALAVVAWPRSPQPPPLEIVAAGTPARVVTVHVSGAVATPGLVEVPAGGRVADAVAAAGGAGPDADLGSLNLAAPVGEGVRIVVPPSRDDGVRVPVDSGGPVRLNTAGESELEALPGVGPVLAARIVAHREERGPFEAVEDLLDVPGIGEAKLATFRDAVTVP